MVKGAQIQGILTKFTWFRTNEKIIVLRDNIPKITNINMNIYPDSSNSNKSQQYAFHYLSNNVNESVTIRIDLLGPKLFPIECFFMIFKII